MSILHSSDNHEKISTLLKNISDGDLEHSLSFYLQPIINLESGVCCGAEALVRGMVNGELLSPALFINTLEKNGDIRKIGIFVLRQALKFAKKNQLHLRENFSLSSNFSPVEINDRAVVSQIISMVDEENYPQESIMIEITETDIPLSIQGQKNAQWLQDWGFSVAWDDITQSGDLYKNNDFFCSDVMKLDRSLLNGECLSLTQHIISSCQNMKLDIIAEGVEYAWQRDWLIEHGVVICQGYYYSPPVATDVFVEQFILPGHFADI